MPALTRTRPRRPVPLFEGLLPIDPARVSIDVVAGITLAALAIPEVMGYTKIAGMPVITGLYTIVLPIALFAIFGSSRHLVVGADSATAAILATGLVGMAAPASPQYVALASTLALMASVLLIVARVLRLGFLANFLSRSVLIGFLTGVGIQVAVGEVPGMLGLAKIGSEPVEQLANVVTDLARASGPTLAVSIGVLAVIVGSGRIDRRIPGALIAVVGSITLSAALDWRAQGISTLGDVPCGLPQIGIPAGISADDLAALLPTAFAIFVVILAQSAATSRAYAMRYSDSFSENVDLVGLSLSNVAAGLSGTFVVNGSPTKTEMVDSAGGRSQLSQLAAAAIVLIVLLFLTAPLSYLPDAVLAAVVFLIGVRLVDYRGMADIFRLRKGEFAVALITALVVIFIGVEQGILGAMALSIVEHLYHSYRPYDVLLAPTTEGELRGVSLVDGTQALPGLLIYRFGSGIYYANTSRFTEEVLRLVEDAEPAARWVCLAGSAIGDIDYQGSDTIRQLHGQLGRMGVTLVIADVSEHVRRQLDDYGLTDTVGKERIFESASEVMAAYRSTSTTTAAPPPSA